MIHNYDQVDDLKKDVIKEIGSIGTGNAATSLSSMLSCDVKIELPDVKVLKFNDAIYSLGSPEDAVVAVFSRFEGDVDGIMLFILDTAFAKDVVLRIMNQEISDILTLDEISLSALTEVGNIVISSYIRAMSNMIDLKMSLTAPVSTVNMLGGIMNVAMVEVGYETDKLMMVKGKFIVGDVNHDANLLMVPQISSLNEIFKKLGIV